MVGVEFVGFFEFDFEIFVFYLDRFYLGKIIEIIELIDGLSRMFYLVFFQILIKFGGEFEFEFIFFFNVNSREVF